MEIAPIGLYYENLQTHVWLINVEDRANPEVEAKWKYDGSYVDSRMVDGVLHLVINQFPYIPYDFDLLTLTIDDVFLLVSMILGTSLEPSRMNV